jgi:5-methylcytosine-specific restriction endonuclease McrA
MSRGRVRYYSPKRRAIYAKGDQINALVLFKLYDWTCCLCGNKIDPRRRLPDWRAATIEHLIPLSAGGTHTWENTRPAHAKCNFDKGDSLPVFTPDILIT